MNLYEQTVPQFIRILRQVNVWIDKTEAFATSKKFDVNTLLTARLAPDMFPLVRQLQSISDGAKGHASRLTGTTAPSFPDEEKTFAEIRTRIDKTIAYLETFKPEQFDGAAERVITLAWNPGKGIKGCDYLVGFALPNFYFHCTTAYAILRHNGIDVGKMDFLGPVQFFDV